MLPRIDHQVNASFMEWFNNHLLEKGRAYTNFTGPLFRVKDVYYKNYNTFMSYHSQWVYDSSITGAAIPTSLNTTTPVGTILDFNNGRIHIPVSQDGFGPNTVLAITYAYKDYNIFVSDEREDALLWESKFVERPKVAQNASPTPPSVALQGNEKYIPSIYIKMDAGYNDPFCLGGTDMTTFKFTAFVFSDNKFQHDGVCGIFRDSEKYYLPLLPLSTLPFDSYGAIRNNPYNYVNIAGTAAQNPDNLMYINQVDVHYLPQKENTDIGRKILVALIDFQVELVRYARL